MHEIGFWLAVGLASVIFILLFKFVASKVGWTPLQTLAAAV